MDDNNINLNGLFWSLLVSGIAIIVVIGVGILVMHDVKQKINFCENKTGVYDVTDTWHFGHGWVNCSEYTILNQAVATSGQN